MKFRKKCKCEEKEVELNCKCNIDWLLCELESIKKSCNNDCQCNICCEKFNEIYCELISCLKKCKCNKCNCTCPAGAQGPQGPQGVQGPKGDQGEPGTAGTEGSQGVQGPKGDQGEPGTAGAQGYQGIQGAQGSQGIQGPEGAQGLKGDQGEPGTAGTEGSQGVQGLKGDQGEPGTAGTEGSQGVQGPKGDQGEPGTAGAEGYQGVQGPQGPQGLQGEPGTCECLCLSIGEQVLNGDMEEFEDDTLVDWETTTPDLISQTTAQGNVHSGNSAAALEDGAILTQEIEVNEDCYYELSFFALANGAQVSLTATVLFDDIVGAEIIINAQDFPNSNRNYGYYKIITTAVPMGITTATIKFEVAANGEQSLNLDDVSFSVA